MEKGMKKRMDFPLCRKSGRRTFQDFRAVFRKML